MRFAEASRMKPRLPAVAVALVLGLAVAGCGDSGERSGEAGPARSAAAAEGEGPDGSVGPSAAAGSGSGSSAPEQEPGSAPVAAVSLEELVRLVAAWRNPDVRAMGECMYDEGFPQYMESMSELEGDLVPWVPMRIHPVNYEPISESQARQHGMIGIALSESGNKVGNVVTSDPAYFQAIDQCKQSLRGATSAEETAQMASLAASLQDLVNEVNTRFTNALVPVIRELLDERLSCVRDNGYPLLDVEGAHDHVSWHPILEGAGVELAEQPPEGAAAAQLEGGASSTEIRVLLPSEMTPVYRPSQSEIDFAVVFAACGNEVAALERLQDAQSSIRAEILPGYEAVILGLSERVLEILDG